MLFTYQEHGTSGTGHPVPRGFLDLVALPCRGPSCHGLSENKVPTFPLALTTPRGTVLILSLVSKFDFFCPYEFEYLKFLGQITEERPTEAHTPPLASRQSVTQGCHARLQLGRISDPTSFQGQKGNWQHGRQSCSPHAEESRGRADERFRSISLELGLSPTVMSQGGSTSLWDDHVEVRRWYVVCSTHYDLRSPL